MSLEKQLTDATAAQNALTQTVANKMGQIDAKVASQKAAHDAWMHGAKSDFASIKQQSIFVGGSPDKWYPVCIPLPNMFGKIDISRYTHNDKDKYGEFNGAFRLLVFAANGSWGGYPTRLIPMSYQYFLGKTQTNPFVGNIGLASHGTAFVAYLLGARTYSVTTSWPSQPVIHTLDKANLVFRWNHDRSQDVYLDALTAVSASMLPNNYLRGG